MEDTGKSKPGNEKVGGDKISPQSSILGLISSDSPDSVRDLPLTGNNNLSGDSIITARGTVDGVVIRLDGRVGREGLRSAIEEFLTARESFLGGNEVSLEWVGAKPDESVTAELSTLLSERFNITVRSSKLREVAKTSQISSKRAFPAEREEGRAKSLFDGMEAFSAETRGMDARSGLRVSESRGPAASAYSQRASATPARMDSFWDDADARIVYTTLRSGQKIESDHSIVIFGDVNSGAEIVAGGDIVVLGTLRGVAHAGAYDETGGGRVIMALNLQPTQLRIGMVISRGSSEGAQKSPEIARVEGGLIVVEPYSVKNLARK